MTTQHRNKINKTASTASAPAGTRGKRFEEFLLNTINTIVLILSVLLVVWISVDTFNKIDFLNNRPYMIFQFWVCVFFMIDFVVGLIYADDRWRYFRRRFLFLLLSIPFLNIIDLLHWQPGPDALYFLRFIPLARAALAMSIVFGYLSSNAVTSMCISYITIIIFITYFCSLIFFQRESGINPQVDSYWTALWWSAMNMTTVGSSIVPMTPAGKIVEVVLPICGMIMFPLFTVYLTNYVTGIFNKKTNS